MVKGLLQYWVDKLRAIGDLAAIVWKAVFPGVDAVRPGGVDLRLVGDRILWLVVRLAQGKDHRGQAHTQSQHSAMDELVKVPLTRRQQATSSSDRICTVMNPVYLVETPDNTLYAFVIF